MTHVANLFQSSIRLPVAPREEAEETSSWQIQFSIRFFLSRFVCDSWITFSVAWFSSVRISRAPRVSCSTVPCLWVPYGAAGETGKCWAAPPWWPSVNFRFRHSRNDVTSDPPRLLGLLPLVAFPCFNFSSFSRTLEGDQGRGEKTTEKRQQHCSLPPPTPPPTLYQLCCGILGIKSGPVGSLQTIRTPVFFTLTCHTHFAAVHTYLDYKSSIGFIFIIPNRCPVSLFRHHLVCGFSSEGKKKKMSALARSLNEYQVN